MCGTAGAVCFHGACGVVGNAERCVCDAMYSGSQCLYRGRLRSFELPLAAGAVALTLLAGLAMTHKVRGWLSFRDSPADAFAFPREWARGDAMSDVLEVLEGEERPSTRLTCSLQRFWRVVGVWEVDASKGVPWKPRRRVLENALITLVFLLELMPWVQATAVAFLPVVPWPVAAKPSASALRMSLLYPLWSHLEPSELPRTKFYAALAFVPGVFALSCVLGIKRFPLFKPQPANSPAEDLCSVVLRLYSHWAALPAMIMLLLPLECFFIGYTATGASSETISLLDVDPKCFAVVPIARAAAGIVALLLYWGVSCVVAFQLNCESSCPTPTLWTDVRYQRVDVLLRAPFAMTVIAFGNANGVALCACCIAYGATHALANAWMRPCAHSLITGIRTYGAVVTAWSGAVGLVAALLDDLSVKVTFEIWSLGAIALTALACSTMLLLHLDQCWPLRAGGSGATWVPAKTVLPPPASVEPTKSGTLLPPKLLPRLGLARSRRRTRGSTSTVAATAAPSSAT